MKIPNWHIKSDSSRPHRIREQLYIGYSSYLHSIQKRVVDVFLCLLLMIPVCLVVAMTTLMVLISDGWPVIFLQKRTGKNGVIFTMPKIRTLREDAHPNTPSYCHDIETFMFPLSKTMRRCRLDELPQIFTVLMGKMSFVGPRPELPHVVEDYAKKEIRRLYAKPGLTGLWQIRGSRNEPIHNNMRYDLYYLRNASFWLDMKILAETVSFVIKS